MATRLSPIVLLAALAQAQTPPPVPPAEAPWRAEAARRIDRIRKGTLTVAVSDADGKAVAGAKVELRMKRHAFGFGSAVGAGPLLGVGADNDRYRQAILELFNKAVLENDLKWPEWESNSKRALGALDWLREHGITDIRGHCLVWPSWRRMPANTKELAADPPALRTRILHHIGEELAVTRGKLTEWDVLNEPYTNTDVQKILGDDEMAEWFKRARQADPGAQLYINDFNIVAAGGKDIPHQNHYFSTIENLLKLGAPIDGIGVQGHFSAALTPPERVIEILDRFARFGKPLQVTEFDINIADEALQAQYTRDFMTAAFSHPAISGFMMWGFWEGRHWRPLGAMIRRDWSFKPNYEVYRDLVFRQWWTNAEGITDAGGRFGTRGFLGEYDVTVSLDGRRQTLGTKLPAAGTTLNVVLK